MGYAASYMGLVKITNKEGLIHFLQEKTNDNENKNIPDLMEKYLRDCDASINVSKSGEEMTFSGFSEYFQEEDLEGFSPFIEGSYEGRGEDGCVWVTYFRDGCCTTVLPIEIMPSGPDDINAIETVTKWLADQLNIDPDKLQEQIDKIKGGEI